jgi:hypothetical protein
MEKFIQDIATTYWWVSVVIVGIIVNIISSYLKPFLENKLSLVSGYWKQRKEKRKEEFESQVALLAADDRLLSIYALREFRYRIRSVSYLVMSSLLFIIATWAQAFLPISIFLIISFIGTLIMIISLDDHFDAIQVKKVVEASTNGIQELKP